MVRDLFSLKIAEMCIIRIIGTNKNSAHLKYSDSYLLLVAVNLKLKSNCETRTNNLILIKNSNRM